MKLIDEMMETPALVWSQAEATMKQHRRFFSRYRGLRKMRRDPLAAFDYTNVIYGDKKVRGIVAVCGHCGLEIKIPVNTQQYGNDDEGEWLHVAKKMQRLGWHAGKSKTAHRCARCFSGARFAAIRKSNENREGVAMAKTPDVPTLQVVSGGAAPPPASRPMSREDRRVIFEKLNEVYVDDRAGYTKGWTDEKVATDLGVPRAWVKQIRDENFGDEITNEDIREQIAEATAVLKDINLIRPDVQRLFAVADKIEQRLTEIAKVFK
jgi:hypothetical protein